MDNIGRNFFRNSMLFIQFFICFIFVISASIVYFQCEINEDNTFQNFSNNEKERIYFIETYVNGFNEENLKTRDVLKKQIYVEDILEVDNRFSTIINSLFSIGGKNYYCDKKEVSQNFPEFANLRMTKQKTRTNDKCAFAFIFPNDSIDNITDHINIYNDISFPIKGVYEYVNFSPIIFSKNNVYSIFTPIDIYSELSFSM